MLHKKHPPDHHWMSSFWQDGNFNLTSFTLFHDGALVAALVTDVVKMFRQFLVHPDDLDWQRLLWRDSINAPIEDYVALTVTYALNSAPYLAMMSILQLAEDGWHSHPLAHLILTNQIYIDIFLAADHEEQVIAQRNQLIDLLATTGLQLGKWSSTLPEVL